jgi:hypothetical protein
VCPDWVYMCRDEGRRIEESIFPHTYNPKMSLNVTTSSQQQQSRPSRKKSMASTGDQGELIKIRAHRKIYMATNHSRFWLFQMLVILYLSGDVRSRSKKQRLVATDETLNAVEEEEQDEEEDKLDENEKEGMTEDLAKFDQLITAEDTPSPSTSRKALICQILSRLKIVHYKLKYAVNANFSRILK